MKKLLIVFVAAAAVFAAEAQGARRPSGPAPQPRGQMARPANRGGRGAPQVRYGRGNDGQLSKHDQRLIEDIESASSAHALRRYLQAAVSSRTEEVRMAMVDALGNAEGMHSVADLAYFFADPSEDVAESAFSAWTSALEDARGHRRVRAIIEAAQILQGGKWQGQTPSPMPAPGMVPVAPAVVQPVQTVVQPSTVPVTQPATVPVTQPVVY